MVRCSRSHDNALVSAITLKEDGSVFECPGWVFPVWSLHEWMVKM